MAHHRLGHAAEARLWLEHFRDLPSPSTPLLRSLDELEIELTHREAEAVVLLDPVFPADPFAPP
jgi:hypothetical protein